jgi:hypothetical protein
MDDIISVIFTHLPVEYCVRYQIVCNKWRQLLTSQRLWKIKCAQYWPTYPLHDISDYFKLFLERGGAFFITSLDQLRRIYKEEIAAGNEVPNVPHLTIWYPSMMNCTFKLQRSNGLTLLFTRSYVDEEEKNSEDGENPKMETYWTQLRRTIGPHPNVTVPVRTFGGKDNVTTLHESMVENSAWEYIMRDSSGKLTEKKIAQVVTAMLHGVKYTSELGINLYWEARPNIIYDARGDWIEFKWFDYGYSAVNRSFFESTPLLPLDACSYIDLPKKAEEINIWGIGAFLYYFLYGANPYSNMNVILAYKTLARDGVVFPEADERNESGEVYDDYSADVKDLISKMLVVAPERRVSVADALNHPWIQSPPNKFLQHLHAELSEKYSKFRLPAAGPFLEFGDKVLDD